MATDDWPYIYLQKPADPVLYWILQACCPRPGVVWPDAFGASAGSRLGLNWSGGRHFLFLGAAFLLLEVQNISKAAVVLGNTWLVNAVIISGVLVMVLLSKYRSRPAGRGCRWPGSRPACWLARAWGCISST